MLSAGHASMLLYALLHLAGVRALGPDGRPMAEPAVSLDDIRRFRQLGSRCPGHPEHRWTSGVETTTGPLGQGVATSLFDYDVYALCGDGDDNNRITIEGKTDLAF